jgi:hypothetical protein
MVSLGTATVQIAREMEEGDEVDFYEMMYRVLCFRCGREIMFKV